VRCALSAKTAIDLGSGLQPIMSNGRSNRQLACRPRD